MSKSRSLLLSAVETDSTFERVRLDGELVWVGKCIHCNAKLVVALDGTARSAASIEHIIPQTRGGDDDVRNLAVACASCNSEKGRRHDHKRGLRFADVVGLLQKRRTARWRPAPP